MKSSTSVSISGYGGYVPKLRLPTSEVAKLWKGGGSGPNKAKSVASIDEDTTTMSVEAARDAILMAGDCNIGAVFVGTESKPYAVKPTSTIVAQALGINRTLAADFEFACKAGTEAMQVITGLIGSNMIDSGLALGVDTAQGRPGDSLEYTAGSAAAAFVLSSAGLVDLSLVLSSEVFADLSLPSSVVTVSSAPSATPSADTSPSAVVSSVFSGSTKIVGAATVAITKSLSVIVGTTFSGSLTEDILILVPISVLSRSTIISFGIFSVGHFSSTFLLTVFKTPPFFNPGDLS